MEITLSLNPFEIRAWFGLDEETVLYMEGVLIPLRSGHGSD